LDNSFASGMSNDLSQPKHAMWRETRGENTCVAFSMTVTRQRRPSTPEYNNQLHQEKAIKQKKFAYQEFDSSP
jgi:hypothetical protein